MLFFLAMVSAMTLKVSSKIDFQIEYTPWSLTESVWVNVGTLTGKDLTALKGTVKDTDGTNSLCFDNSQSDQSYINYIDYDINSAVNPELTMIIWENPDPNADRSRHVLLGHDDAGFDRCILIDDPRFDDGIAMGVGSVYSSAISTPTPGEWSSIAVTFSKSSDTAIVYKNGGDLSGGEQQEVTITADSGGKTQLSLNGLQQYADRTLIGCIGRVQIVNQVLSAQEVAAVFSEGIERAPGLPFTTSEYYIKPIQGFLGSTIACPDRVHQRVRETTAESHSIFTIISRPSGYYSIQCASGYCLGYYFPIGIIETVYCDDSDHLFYFKETNEPNQYRIRFVKNDDPICADRGSVYADSRYDQYCPFEITPIVSADTSSLWYNNPYRVDLIGLAMILIVFVVFIFILIRNIAKMQKYKAVSMDIDI